MSNALQIRMFNADSDYGMIAQWWDSRGLASLPVAILPKLGVIVEGKNPICALWLYMDNSTGVCFLEHAVSAPGTSLKLAREAFGMGIEWLKSHVSTPEMGNYFIMLLRCSKAVARIAQAHGFEAYQQGSVCMAAPLVKGEE